LEHFKYGTVVNFRKTPTILVKVSPNVPFKEEEKPIVRVRTKVNTREEILDKHKSMSNLLGSDAQALNRNENLVSSTMEFFRKQPPDLWLQPYKPRNL